MPVTGSHRLTHMLAWESLPQPVPGMLTFFADTSGTNNNLSLLFRLDPFSGAKYEWLLPMVLALEIPNP